MRATLLLSILLLIQTLGAVQANDDLDAKYEALMNYKLGKGPAWSPPPPSLANTAEVRAADNKLRKMCEGFDTVNAQNKFLPIPLHNEMFRLHKRALENDTHAQTEIADRYIDGRNLPQDWKTGLCWYRAAAQHGSSYAEYWLGLFYQHGWVVEQSAPVAAHWFNLAARHRDSVVAQRRVADRYADDDSGVYDMGKAFLWYERAAQKGDVDAELALGNFYITSHTPDDIKRALSWYGKASAQHSIVADYNIGQIYYRGVGIPQDLTQAHKWLLRAAQRGYAPAQYDLAQMYYKGIGVSQDWVTAYAWLETSNAMEYNPAARELEDMLITHFNPQQLNAASHLARDYKSKYRR